MEAMLVPRGLLLVWCCLLELGRAGNPRPRFGPWEGITPKTDVDFTSCRFQASLSWSHLLQELTGGVSTGAVVSLEVSADGKPLQTGLTCTLGDSSSMPLPSPVDHLLKNTFSLEGEVDFTTVGKDGKLEVPVSILGQLIAGVPFHCGSVVSCVQVNPGWKDVRQFWSEVKLLDDPQVKETHPETGRHLLALNENAMLPGDLVFSPLFTILCALVAAMVLIFAVALCVCKDTKATSTTTSEPANVVKEATPKDNRKSATSNKSQLTVTADEGEVKLEMEACNRHSNGSVVRDSTENGRPRSHDQRALPAIPPINAAGGVGQTDDEDEDEGHYDTINRGRQPASARKAKPGPSSPEAATPRVQNLYEKVDDDRDSTYAGVKESDSSDPDYSGVKPISNPYAVVDGIGNADYAHIEEKKAKRNSPIANASVQRVQAMGAGGVMKASTETLDSYSSIPPPPVPDKHFDSDDQANASLNSSLAAPSPTPDRSSNSSPSLPPRNGSSPHAEISHNQNATTVVVGNPVVAMTTTPAGASIVPVNQDVVDGSGGPSSSGKKEPRYSSVTARESLANLRERQAQFVQSSGSQHTQGNGTLDSNDTTYETVNYDEIKAPHSAGGNPAQVHHADRQSLTSDLYAEIASGSGENSARSSTYARVGDIHAPTPPPLEILKKLSVPPEGEDELPDPGYSMIRRNRPVSAFSSVSGSSHMHREPVREQLYAVVDKSKKNRNTVHIDGTGAGVSSHIVAGPQQELYAVVQKPRRGRSPLGTRENVPLEYIGTGARPKVRDNGVVSHPNTEAKVNVGQDHGHSRSGSGAGSAVMPASSSEKDDADYTTIGSVGKSEEDPDYDNIVDPIPVAEASPEKDPNYEMVKTAENVTRVRVSPGVATEIVPGADGNPHGLVHVGNRPTQNQLWQRRDHIYQEISDAKREKEQLMLQGGGNERPMSTSL